MVAFETAIVDVHKGSFGLRSEPWMRGEKGWIRGWTRGLESGVGMRFLGVVQRLNGCWTEEKWRWYAKKCWTGVGIGGGESA